MKTYTDNEDIRREIRSAAAAQGKTLADIARALGIRPQSLNDMIRKQHVGFDDVARIADTLGLVLRFELVPAATTTTGAPSAPATDRPDTDGEQSADSSSTTGAK